MSGTPRQHYWNALHVPYISPWEGGTPRSVMVAM